MVLHAQQSINEKQGQGPPHLAATGNKHHRQSSAFCKMDLKGGVGPDGGIQSIGGNVSLSSP